MYHGSKKIFNTFKEHGNDGHILSYLGFHFTSNKNTAEKFARRPEKMVYVVEITVNKTLKIKESELVLDILKWGVKNKYVDPYTYELCLKKPYFSFYKPSIMDLFDKPYYFKKLGSKNGSFEEFSKNYKKYLIRKGYDSIEYLNEIEFDEYPDRYDWIVFSNEQIKIIDTYSLLNIKKSE